MSRAGACRPVRADDEGRARRRRESALPPHDLAANIGGIDDHRSLARPSSSRAAPRGDGRDPTRRAEGQGVGAASLERRARLLTNVTRRASRQDQLRDLPGASLKRGIGRSAVRLGAAAGRRSQAARPLDRIRYRVERRLFQPSVRTRRHRPQALHVAQGRAACWRRTLRRAGKDDAGRERHERMVPAGLHDPQQRRRGEVEATARIHP